MCSVATDGSLNLLIGGARLAFLLVPLMSLTAFQACLALMECFIQSDLALTISALIFSFKWLYLLKFLVLKACHRGLIRSLRRGVIQGLSLVDNAASETGMTFTQS